MATREMNHAIAAFVHGYCFQRSMTQPHQASLVDGIWRLHDEPGPKARREEYVAFELLPQEADRLARRLTQGHYCITAILDARTNDQPQRDEYKELGYRLNHTEAFMRHPLKRIPRTKPPVTIRRVSTQAMAEKLASAAGRRQILPELLAPHAQQRSYVALVGKEVVGWANSVAAGDATYCSGMFVAPAHRRRGIARSLLTRILRDDRACGAKQAVLLASHAGAKLYPVVGYEEMGKALVFTPRR